MAGSQKNFELLFKLKATLGGDFKTTFKQAIDTQKKLQDSLKNVSSIQSKIDGFTKQSAEISKNRQKLEALKKEHDRLQQELKETGEPTEALRRKLEQNESQIQQTTARIQKQESSLNSLGKELQKAGINTDNLTGENERLQKSYEKLKSSQETLQKLNEKQEKIKSSIGQTKTQIAGTMGVIGGVAAAIYVGPVRAAQKYETALAKVSTIADSAKVPMGTMSKEIMALSNSTGIAATTLADDVYNAISAGQDTADAVNFVAYSSKLAKAGFAESAETLDILTTILNAYGMEADKVGMVSDMLIQTQNKGKVTVAELSSVMGKIIPTAKSNGVALEQVTAGYAIMTARGIKAAETTTYMNSMLNELGKSGTAADKALKAASGKGFKALMAEGKSLGEVLNILQENAAKGGKSLEDVFGSSEAGKAAVSLLSDGVEGFNKQVKNMLAASDGIGATQTAFELMEQTTEAKMQKATNSIKNLQIVIGQTFLPMIGTLADKITPVITKISEFAQKNPKLVETIVKVVAALAAARVGFLGLKLAGLSGESGIISIAKKLVSLKAGMTANVATAASLAAKIKGIGGAFGGIAGKILPIVGVITTVITVFKLVKEHLQEIRGFIRKTFGDEALAVFDKVVAIISTVGETVKSIFSSGNIGAASEKIQEVFGDKGTAVFEKLIGILKSVISVAKQIVGFIVTYVVPIVEQVLKVIIEKVIPGIIKFVKAAAPTIMTIIQNIADFIEKIIPVVADAIAALMPVISDIIDFIADYVLPTISEWYSFVASTVLPAIAKMVKALLPVVQTVLQTIVPAIKTGVTNIWNAVSPVIKGILAAVQMAMPFIEAIITNVVNRISGVISGLASILEGIINFISGVFTGNWGQAWEGIKSIFSGVWETIKSVAKGSINTVISMVNGIIGGLNKLKIPDWVPVLGGKGINIPLIPMLAKGSKNTPDTFIAGEAGPELITNAPGRTVFTAEQTKKIMTVQGAANAAAAEAPAVGGGGVQAASTVNVAPTVAAGAGVTNNDRTNHFEIHNAPTIIVNGEQEGDLEAKLEQNNRNLMKQIESLFDDKADKEERQRYE